MTRHIQAQQESTQLIIPKIAFRRLCREIIQDINSEFSTLELLGGHTDVVTASLEGTNALQEAAEAYLHEFFMGKILTCII